MATVRAENLYKIFGRKPEPAVEKLASGASREDLRSDGLVPAVIDASFEAEPGETFVVMGLSGSGKSTLIRMLNGLQPATSGRVFVDDEDVTELRSSGLRRLRSRTMSMVFQHFALFPHRTVGANAAYGLEVLGVGKSEREHRAQESLSMVGLDGWGDSYPGHLSGGMKQRVGLARALATDTDVLLMDEAFSALDPLIRREMQDQLVELQHRLQKTIIFITHDLNEAMKLGDRIAMMRDGRVVQVGTAAEILNDPANDYVATFVEDVDRSRVLTAGAVMVDPAEVAEDERTLGDPVAAEAPTASPETLVVDLLSSAAAATLPLAVVDDRRRLVGVVPQDALLAALGGDQPGAGQEVASATSDHDRTTEGGV